MHEVESRLGENKNFIYIMDVEISSRFSILFEICIVVKETNNAYNVISPILFSSILQQPDRF
jgi:hypothetical protein